MSARYRTDQEIIDDLKSSAKPEIAERTARTGVLDLSSARTIVFDREEDVLRIDAVLHASDYDDLRAYVWSRVIASRVVFTTGGFLIGAVTATLLALWLR